jgi:fructan beta-fructosidase
MLGLVCILGAHKLVTAKDKNTAVADWKPRIHFQDAPLWINDPNGPILLNGQYHLFHQLNPAGNLWGNMSWGHASSTDLVHWTKLPIAIPVTRDAMIFSGSTVQDRRNSSGLCGAENASTCLVAVFTEDSRNSQGLDHQNQNVAFSRDGGTTWTKYAKNPVLDLANGGFRDPKVFWHQASESWVMVVMLSDLHVAQIYRSKDLLHWKLASSFGPAGATGGVWECPDLMNLDVRDAQGNKTGNRWVLSVNMNPGSVAGGSGNQYFVGQFDGTRFIEDHPKSGKYWVDWGKDFYASTSFANIPEDQNRLWIAWMSNWAYADKTPSLPGRGQMTLARHIYLREDPIKGSAEPLVLVQEPVLPAYDQPPASGVLTVEEANARFAKGAPESGVYLIRATLEPGAASEVGVRLRRNTLKADESASEETLVGIDRAKGQVFVDRKKSGDVSFSADFPARTVAPLKHPEAKSIPIEIIVDRNSIEVFAEDGETVLTNLIFPSDASLGLAFYASGAPTGGDATHLSNLEVVPLQ